MPKVSFVIPSYNQGRFLIEAVKSAYTSYLGSCEVIIVDDASTEPKSTQYFDEIRAFYPATKIIHHSENKGLATSRNTGIKASSGEYIQLLDADDLLIPGKVDYQVAQLELSKNVSVSVMGYLLSDGTLSNYKIGSHSISDFEFSLKDFLYKWERGLSIPIHCALFKRETILYNLFEENLRAKEDWVFWCRLAHRGTKIVFLDAVGAVYRQHESSMTKASVTKMAKSWLEASMIVDRIVHDQELLFLDSAVSWYKEYYSPLHHSVEETNKSNNQFINPDETRALTPTTPMQFQFPEPRDEENFSNYKLTVVIPIYNHFRHLHSCIHSVYEQREKQTEIICINDNSSDPRIGKFLDQLTNKDDGLKIIQNEENMGISSVLNKGVELARGEYIAFLDCDDNLPFGAIQRVLDEIQEYPNTDYFFSDRFDIDENDRIIRLAVYGGYSNLKPSGNINEDLLLGMVASHLKVIRKSTILNVGGFNSLFSGVQDWELALKIAGVGTFLYIPEPLYYHRIHTQSVTTADSVSQFRKTNIVRRCFSEKMIHRDVHLSPLISALKINLQLPNKRIELENLGGICITENYVDPRELVQLWQKHNSLIFDARKEFNLEWINFLREFNSFFDIIVCDNPGAMASILGYLWDPQILYYPWKLNDANYDPRTI